MQAGRARTAIVRLMETIEFNTGADGIAVLTIDVKDRSMNVMTPGFLADLASAVDRVASDESVKGAVITSARDSFMAGADLVGLVEDRKSTRLNSSHVKISY